MGNEQEKGYDSVFATRLRNILDKRKITQKALSEQTGISRTSIGYYVNGTNVPDALGLAKIAKSLNVSADYLLGLSEDENNQSTNITSFADIATLLDRIAFITGWSIEAREYGDAESDYNSYDLIIHTGNDKQLFSYYDALDSMRQALKNVPNETTRQLLKPFQKDLKEKLLSEELLPW